MTPSSSNRQKVKFGYQLSQATIRGHRLTKKLTLPGVNQGGAKNLGFINEPTTRLIDPAGSRHQNPKLLTSGQKRTRPQPRPPPTTEETSMRQYYLPAGIAALTTAIIIGALALFFAPRAAAEPTTPPITYVAPAPTPPAPELSVVRVDTTGGHGSGVNIGHGFIITAGHVASAEANVSIKKADGTTATAEVLWVNKTYDVALLRTTNDIGQGSDIDCTTATVGTQVEASGNPMSLEFISTYGRVAGVVREVGPWKEALPVNIAIGSGMSGGPLFALDGRVVGIVVGGALDHVQTGVDSVGAPSYSFTTAGIAMIVPASTVCRLMGRGVGV